MIIKTKYSVGDTVWYIYCRTHTCIIKGVRVTSRICKKFCIKPFTETVIEYLVDGEWVNEDDLYPTKEELLKNL